MRIVHRIAFRASPEQIDQMRDLGMNVEIAKNTALPGDTPMAVCDAAEDHPGWKVLAVLLEQWNYGAHSVWTEFTPLEIESARWLCLSAWNNGFPQPQDLEGFARVTYDLSNWCSKCGGETIQNAPFRLKGEPKWGRRGIMTTFWTTDEFFVPPAVWETVFKPFGIRCRSVANRKGIELSNVVQLVVDEEVDIVTNGLKEIPCDVCHRIRFEWPVRGAFPPFVHEPKNAMAKSKQLLGHGWSKRAVFISQELARALKAHNVRGAEFRPVDAALPAFVA